MERSPFKISFAILKSISCQFRGSLELVIICRQRRGGGGKVGRGVGDFLAIL